MATFKRPSGFGKTLLSIAVVLAVSSTAFAQLPQPRLLSISPLGGKAGGGVELVIRGEDLDDAHTLLFSHPGITATPVTLPVDKFYPQPRPVDGKFTLTLAADVPPGVYEVRAVGPLGVSNGRRFTVGALAEAAEVEPNNDATHAQELPLETTLNGACDAFAYDFFRFTAHAGQRLILHAVSRRLDSAARAVMVLTDVSGRELARSTDTPTGDAMIDFTPPADGQYLVKVYDLLYAGGEAHGYRLAISAGPWIDRADPPALQANAAQPVTLFGRNLPGGEPSTEIGTDGRPLQKLTVQVQAVPGTSSLLDTLARAADASADLFTYRLAGSNPLPLGVAPGPLTAEQEPNNDTATAQKVYPPFELYGRFNPVGDTDWFSFEAKKDQPLAIEVLSNRTGLLTDPIVVLQQVKPDGTATELREVDDATTVTLDKNTLLYRYPIDHADPSLLFTAPEDGTYRLLVRDLYFSSQGDPSRGYRLSIGPPQQAFDLVAFPYTSLHVLPKPNIDLVPMATTLYRGGASPVFVHALRHPGCDGPITVSPENLPPGVTADPLVIPGWRSHGVMVLRTAADAALFAGPIRLVGKSTSAQGVEFVRHAKAAETLVEVAGGSKFVEARIVADLHAAIAEGYVSPIAIDLGAPQVYKVARGGKLQLPIKLQKLGEFKGNLVLTPTDHHPTVKTAPITLNETQIEQPLNIEIDPNTPLGAFSFHLHGPVTVVHRRNPQAADRAAADVQRIEAICVELRKATEQANAARDAAQQALGAADANQAPAAQAAHQSATEAAQKAQDELKVAEETKTAAETRAKQLTDSAAPRDLLLPITSPLITIEVMAAP